MTEAKKKTRQGRKYAAATAWFTKRLNDPNSTDKIKDAAAQRLVETLVHIDTMHDRAQERSLKLKLANVPTETTTPAQALALVEKLKREAQGGK